VKKGRRKKTTKEITPLSEGEKGSVLMRKGGGGGSP